MRCFLSTIVMTPPFKYDRLRAFRALDISMPSLSDNQMFPSISRSLGKWLLGIALFALVLVIVEVQVGWVETLAYWQLMPLPTLTLAFLLFAGSHIVRAYRIYDLVLSARAVPFFAVIKLSALHQFANNLLPMRLGEVVLPLLLKRYFAIRLSRGFARLIWLRVLDLAVMGGVAALLVLASISVFYRWGLLGLGVLSLSLVLILRKVILSRSAKLRDMVHVLAETAPGDIAQWLRLLIWTVLAWGLKLAAITLIIMSFADVGFNGALSGALGAELSGILPLHGLAGAGSYEAAFFAGMALLESPSNELLAVAVNTHLFVLLSTSVVALFSLLIKVDPVQELNVKTPL